MKKMIMVAMVLFSTSTLADEKTITPQEFGTALAETPGKLVNFVKGEVEKTKEYQKKSWADMKTKWPWTMFKGKDNE